MAAFVNAAAGSLTASRVSARRVVGAHQRSVHAPRSQRAVLKMQDGYEISEGSSFDANPLVIGLALIGWVVPSSVPSNIPLLDGKGLTPAFVASISDNLSRWPQGPQLADPFWLLMGMWHVGLFATLIFGTVGYNLRKGNY